MRLRLERRIAYLQNILNVRYPIELVSTVQVSPLVEPPPVDILFNSMSSTNTSIPLLDIPISMSSWTSSPCGNTNIPIIELPLGTESRLCREIEQLDDGMTDMNEEEIQQREEEQKILQDALTQLELDKLLKRKPRVKKI